MVQVLRLITNFCVLDHQGIIPQLGQISICNQLEIIGKLENNKDPILFNFKYFKPIICEKFKENYDSILNNLNALENNFSNYKEIKITIYNLTYCLDIQKLKKNLIKVNNLLK